MSSPSPPWPEEERGRLIGLAYRIVGTMDDAEDIVQDAYLRWHRADTTAIERPFSWLATTVSRLAIDHMRSARKKREVYFGRWLPEPIVSPDGPEAPPDPVELADDVTFALMLVLEQLSPKERAAFLLHDAFDFGYGELAEALSESKANCRQLVSRARRRIDAEKANLAAPTRETRKTLLAFAKAIRDGDAAQLMALLDENVVYYGDGGGQVLNVRNPIYGREKVTRYFTRVPPKADPRRVFAEAWINGSPGLIGRLEGAIDWVLTLTVTREGKIARIAAVNNPDKLRRANSAVH